MTVAPSDETAFDHILLAASESLAISDVALIPDSVTIELIAVSDMLHDWIEPVEAAYWNKGRWNIDAYAES